MTYLLTEADSGASVEGQENERILRDVFLKAFIEKTVWIEFLGYIEYKLAVLNL